LGNLLAFKWIQFLCRAIYHEFRENVFVFGIDLEKTISFSDVKNGLKLKGIDLLEGLHHELQSSKNENIKK